MKIIKLFILLITCMYMMTSVSPSLASNGNAVGIKEHPGGRIAFNFVDVEIPAVIKFISDITGYNFIFDERIKGKITIIAPAKLTVAESFNLFTSVLSLKGFTTIPAGPNTYKIIPSSLAKQSGVIETGKVAPVNEAYITKLIPVNNIKADEALQFLRPIISRDGHISSFGPGNMLLVVDSAMNIEKVMSILKLIDKPSATAEEAGIHVYFLQHADATDLAKVLQGIIKDLQTSYKIPGRARKNGESTAPPILSVTPDTSTNSLIIVAPNSEFKEIESVIKTLDKKRKQVFVEAMIVEASVDKLRELGSKWRAAATQNNEPIVVGGVGAITTDTLLNIVNGLSGISVGGMGNFIDIPVTSFGADGSTVSQTLTAPGFAALFSLNDFKDVINVLSTPQILTSDNKEAEILVGENVPFISQRERDITTTSTVLNSITRTDVGIKLQITPQITEGDYVKLDIFQEISAVKDTSEDVLITVGPTTTKRSTKTSVVVRDGHTVVIGGLMQERDEESVFKIPVLGDIPVLEWLFKYKTTSKNKTNLLVFLSPHVVKESSQLTKITKEKQNDFVTRQKFYNPGELMVRFRDDVPHDRALEILSQKKAAIIEYLKDTNTYHIRLKKGEDVEEAQKEYSALPEVLYAEPNYRIKLPVNPESGDPDPRLSDTPPAQDSSSALDTYDTADMADVTSDSTMEGTQGFPSLVVSGTDTTGEDNTPPQPEVGGGGEISSDSPVGEDITPVEHVDSSPVPSPVDEDSAASMVDEPADAPVEKIDSATASNDQSDNNNERDVKEALTDSIESASPDTEPPMSARRHTDAGNDTTVIRHHFIQVGSWKHQEYALEAMEKLKDSYSGVYLVKQGKFNKVRIPGAGSAKEDNLILKDLQETYHMDPILVTN